METISIKRGEQDRIATVDYNEEEAVKHKLYISYDISNETGSLYIKLKESMHFWADVTTSIYLESGLSSCADGKEEASAVTPYFV